MPRKTIKRPVVRKKTYAKKATKRKPTVRRRKVGGTFRPAQQVAVQAPGVLGASAKVRQSRSAAGSVERVTSSHIKGPYGVSDITNLKMSWGTIVSGQPFGSYYLLANTIIDPDLSAVSTNFQYTTQWAGFYNYYQVNASKISITLTNTDDQPKVVVIFPTIYPPGSGNVPLTLEAALHYPHAKHMYITDLAGSRGINTIHHYVDVKKFMTDNVPYNTGGTVFTGPSTAGRMPSVAWAGAATQPSAKLWWVMQLYPTNDTGAGSTNQDVAFSLEDYVDLFGTVLQTNLSMLNQDPLWLADHPDYQPPVDPLDPGGTVPEPIFQTIETKKYLENHLKLHAPEGPVDEVDEPVIVYPVLKPPGIAPAPRPTGRLLSTSRL